MSLQYLILFNAVVVAALLVWIMGCFKDASSLVGQAASVVVVFQDVHQQDLILNSLQETDCCSQLLRDIISLSALWLCNCQLHMYHTYQAINTFNHLFYYSKLPMESQCIVLNYSTSPFLITYLLCPVAL